MIVFLIGCLSPTSDPKTQQSLSEGDDYGCFGVSPKVDDRQVIVHSTPYNDDGSQGVLWNASVFDASSKTMSHLAEFEMGRKTIGTISFTPDGSHGFVAQQDGTIGQFRIEEQGVTVLETGLTGDWYAQDVWFDPADGKLWIVDPNWPENGGGIYHADVDCETGEIGSASLALPTKNAFGVFPLDLENIVVVAREAFDSTAQVFLLDRASLALIDSAVAFTHEDYNLSAVGISPSHVFVGDNSSFSGTPNGFVAIELTTEGFGTQQWVAVLDPVSLVPSKDGSVMLVSSGYGDALHQYLPHLGELTEVVTSSASALPGVGARIHRGYWEGSVLVPENLAIRLLSLAQSQVKDEGKIHQAEGFSGMIGSVGITP